MNSCESIVFVSLLIILPGVIYLVIFIQKKINRKREGSPFIDDKSLRLERIGQTNALFRRAKVNPKPWKWEPSHEMGWCDAVGARRHDAIPTRRTPRPHVGRDLHVPPQSWAYEAGGNEDAGCVLAPRKA
jgi:hypothetical protein